MNDTMNNTPIYSMETLIAIEIKKILNVYNLDVFYQKNNGIYGIINNFKFVGSFEFKHSYFDSPHRYRNYFDIEIQYTDTIGQKNRIFYGQNETENFLVPFFEALKKDLSIIPNLKKSN